MARKVTKQQLKSGAGWKWFKKSFRKVRNHVVKHVKKHGRRAIAHGKKVAKAAAKQAKAAAIEAGKEMLEQAKEEGKQLLQQTIDDATEAAVGHVRKHVCSTVGSGFFEKEKKKIRKAAHKEMDAIHRKGMAHVRSGGKKGAGIQDHVDKVGDRMQASVDRVKNSAKARIRSVAGCDEGSGMQMRGSGFRVRGAGAKKKKCTCH